MDKNKESLSEIVVQERDTDIFVKCGDTSMIFWKYGESDVLHVNLGYYAEFHFGNDGNVKEAIKILQWYLENMDKVPILDPVISDRTDKVLYGFPRKR